LKKSKAIWDFSFYGIYVNLWYFGGLAARNGKKFLERFRI
jgi:hypothetical protein